jgi:hypothetical protein
MYLLYEVDSMHTIISFSGLQEIQAQLDVGMRDSLEEVHSKSLKKLAAQNDPGIYDIDDTILR